MRSANYHIICVNVPQGFVSAMFSVFRFWGVVFFTPRNQYIKIHQFFFLYSRGCEYKRGMICTETNSQEFGKYVENNCSKILSCIRASASTGPACIRAKINSSRMFSCMYWFCAGGYFHRGFLAKKCKIKSELPQAYFGNMQTKNSSVNFAASAPHAAEA